MREIIILVILAHATGPLVEGSDVMTSRKKNAEITGADRDIIAGLFRSQADAERAVRDLKDAGFAKSRIGVAMQDREGQRELAESTGGTTSPAGEGATAGALNEGILGGVVGLLAGVGALTIPGVGPIIAGGALASALAGAGIGAAAGGLMGALVALGVPEDDARYFETGLQEGSLLVTVDAGLRGLEARQILRASGADLGGSDPETVGDPDLFAGRREILVEDEDLSDAGEAGREAWRGSERRYRDDLTYAGPERRFSHR
jgi:hypothetical protein